MLFVYAFYTNRRLLCECICGERSNNVNKEKCACREKKESKEEKKREIKSKNKKLHRKTKQQVRRSTTYALGIG